MAKIIDARREIAFKELEAGEFFTLPSPHEGLYMALEEQDSAWSFKYDATFIIASSKTVYPVDVEIKIVK